MATTELGPRDAFERNVEQYVEDVWNGEQYDRLTDLMAPECPVMGEEVVVTPEMHEDTIRRWRAAFPDLSYEVDYSWFDEESGLGAFTTVMSGTFEHDLVVRTEEGEMVTFEPTGESFEYRGVAIGRFEDGVVVEIDGFNETLEMFQQLGLVPELAELAA